ncbi:hypothetical protein Clacol_006473 [Clathrus columnatus]|uniref:SGNH hydrolase-type esterase domain-containing protein n=1 Tax=Clathrus columnatus TaxID=1419009 RepID=A0AAV5AER8_9AGAM|nr:hypothetical protein Clacol_006473 [Clathrus columnatus]
MSETVQDGILLFGDSITQGSWQPNGLAQKLAYVYARKLDVINRGLSGYNSEWGLSVFKQILSPHNASYISHLPKIRLLTLWFGANDACIPPSPQHVPLSRFESNIRELITIITTPSSAYYSPVTKIILITPPPVNTYQRGAELAARDPPVALDRTFETTKSYAEKVGEIGKSLNIPVLDVWNALYDAAGHDEKALSQFMDDGLHLNGEGYEIAYNLLIETIKTHFSQLHYDNIPMVFPPWAEIDWANPGPLTARKFAPDT